MFESTLGTRDDEAHGRALVASAVVLIAAFSLTCTIGLISHLARTAPHPEPASVPMWFPEEPGSESAEALTAPPPPIRRGPTDGSRDAEPTSDPGSSEDPATPTSEPAPEAEPDGESESEPSEDGGTRDVGPAPSGDPYGDPSGDPEGVPGGPGVSGPGGWVPQRLHATPPRRRYTPEFEYPASATGSDLPAVVCQATVRVDERGRLDHAWIDGCPDEFRTATLQGLYRARWYPARDLEGRRVPGSTRLSVRFVLE